MQQEHKGITERDVRATHVHKTMRPVVKMFQTIDWATHGSVIGFTDNRVIIAGSKWRARNKSIDRRWWVRRVSADISVGRVTRCACLRVVIASAQPRLADGLGAVASVSHEVWREQVQRSSQSSA